MIRLVFFAPYPGMQSTIRQVIAERPDHDDFQYEIIQDFFNNPLDTSTQISPSPVDLPLTPCSEKALPVQN